MSLAQSKDVTRRCANGELLKIIRGIYSDNIIDPMHDVVVQNLWQIAPILHPHC